MVVRCVQDMFLHAWHGYEKYAWGKDTLKPVSRQGDDNFLGMAITLVDSLDTMLIMGLDTEFKKARDWVAQHLVLASQVRTCAPPPHAPPAAPTQRPCTPPELVLGTYAAAGR